MRTGLFALFLLTLTGCSYMRVTIHYVETEAELRAACGGDPLNLEPLGCARGGVLVTPHSQDCEITAYRPRGFDDHRRLETLGHELFHCQVGAVHI